MISKLLKTKDVAGNTSRGMVTGQVVAVLGALQVGLPLVGAHVPPEYQWIYGLVMCGLGVWLAYVRSTTTTAME